jgi:hypothetical protein
MEGKTIMSERKYVVYNDLIYFLGVGKSGSKNEHASLKGNAIASARLQIERKFTNDDILIEAKLSKLQYMSEENPAYEAKLQAIMTSERIFVEKTLLKRRKMREEKEKEKKEKKERNEDYTPVGNSNVCNKCEVAVAKTNWSKHICGKKKGRKSKNGNFTVSKDGKRNICNICKELPGTTIANWSKHVCKKAILEKGQPIEIECLRCKRNIELYKPELEKGKFIIVELIKKGERADNWIFADGACIICPLATCESTFYLTDKQVAECENKFTSSSSVL